VERKPGGGRQGDAATNKNLTEEMKKGTFRKIFITGSMSLPIFVPPS